MAHKGNANLTEAEVYKIREQLARYDRREPGGASPRELCSLYGMSIEAIRKIHRREAWVHLPEVPVETPEEQKRIDEARMKALAKFQEDMAAGKIEPLKLDPRLSPTERMVQAIKAENKKQEALDPDKSVLELSEEARKRVEGYLK